MTAEPPADWAQRPGWLVKVETEAGQYGRDQWTVAELGALLAAGEAADPIVKVSPVRRGARTRLLLEVEVPVVWPPPRFAVHDATERGVRLIRSLIEGTYPGPYRVPVSGAWAPQWWRELGMTPESSHP